MKCLLHVLTLLGAKGIATNGARMLRTGLLASMPFAPSSFLFLVSVHRWAGAHLHRQVEVFGIPKERGQQRDLPQELALHQSIPVDVGEEKDLYHPWFIRQFGCNYLVKAGTKAGSKHPVLSEVEVGRNDGVWGMLGEGWTSIWA